MFIYERRILEKLNEQIREKSKVTLNGSRLNISVFTAKEGDEEAYELKAEGELDLTENRYTSYYFALVKKYNEVKGRFIKVHPYTAASKVPMQEFDELLVGEHVTVYFQIDIGNIAVGDEKLAIKTLRVPAKNIQVEGFSSCNVIQYDEEIITPRKVVWDRYALQIGDQLAGCDNTGRVLIGRNIEVALPERFLEVKINKYTPNYQQRLNDEVDNEVLFIETTAGVLNTSRVTLVNGTGSFKLYPMEYTGKCKIKLGWKYYSGWSEYEITIKEQP